MLPGRRPRAGVTDVGRRRRRCYPTPVSVVLLVAGIVMLVVGGDVLVRSAAALAVRLGVSSLVIGLTVVAFGTSAPELAATLVSSLRGVPDLGVGNVLGSNVANVGLILGLTAMIAPIASSASLVRRELPVVVGTMLLLFPLMWNGVLGRLEGALLLGLLAGYLGIMVWQDEGALDEELPSDADRVPTWRAAGGAAVGILLLVGGAEVLVRGAVDIATALGVSERVIGLTMVAVGTSLPELASALAAAARRQGTMILGNVAGSNIFNVLAVLGATSAITPIPIDRDAVFVDLAVATAFSLALLPMMGLRAGLGKKRGALLLAAYLAYVAVVYLQRVPQGG